MRLGVILVGAAVGCVGLMVPQPARAEMPPTATPNAAPPQREGRITVARGINSGTPSSSADAIFTSSPVWGAVVGSDGPCMIHKHVATDGLSAGMITIAGTSQPIKLEESPAGKYKHTAAVPNPSFVDGATISVEASGGADLPAFRASVTAPTALAGYTPPTSLSRTGYTATWTAASGPGIMIIIVAVNPRMNDGVLVMCHIEDTGSSLSRLPRSA